MKYKLEDEQVRVTVRLSKTLYDQLQAVAGIGPTWGYPQMGDVIRSALAHYVQCAEVTHASHIWNASTRAWERAPHLSPKTP